MASHEEHSFVWNGETKQIMPGQILTGRQELVKISGIPGTTIERILNFFENEHQIGQQKTTKFRLITIENWEGYQQNGQQNGQQTDNKRTTNGHHKDTYKNEEKVEKEKKVRKNMYGSRFKRVLLTDEEYQKLVEQFGEGLAKEKIDSLDEYMESSGRRYKSHYATILTWDRRDKSNGQSGKRDLARSNGMAGDGSSRTTGLEDKYSGVPVTVLGEE